MTDLIYVCVPGLELTCYGCYYLGSDELMIKNETRDKISKMGTGCCALMCTLKKRYLTHKDVLDTPKWCPQLPPEANNDTEAYKAFRR